MNLTLGFHAGVQAGVETDTSIRAADPFVKFNPPSIKFDFENILRFKLGYAVGGELTSF